MYVITADQKASRSHGDLVPEALAIVSRVAAGRLALPADRTTGDEIQLATQSPEAAMDAALGLAREGMWSVGIGVGDVESPFPREIRAARGGAFIHARNAVERAKSLPWRLAVSGDDEVASSDVEAFVHLLLEVRARRSPHGWELADLLARGMTQKRAAARLGITESAVSRRATAAGLRADKAATPALGRALGRLNGGT